MKLEEMKLDVEQHVEVKADIGDVFKGVLHRFGQGSTNPNGESMQMILEPWPGGRWFRDRGNGIGHATTVAEKPSQLIKCPQFGRATCLRDEIREERLRTNVILGRAISTGFRNVEMRQ